MSKIASKPRVGERYAVSSAEVAALLSWMSTAAGVAGALRGEVEQPPAHLLPEVLSAFWLMLSRLFFGDALPVLPVVVVPDAGRLVCRWEPDARRVVVAAHCAKAYPWALARVLHEAVRVYCAEVRKAPEASYYGHGPVFAEEANRLGELLGLAAVAPKGRDGKARAVDWPARKPPPPSPAGPVELGHAAPAALLPIEVREVEALRAQVAEARREAADARAKAGAVSPADAAARLLLVRCCGAVGRAVERVERDRDAAVKVSTHGGRTAAARAAVRLLAGLRGELVALVGDDPDAVAALGLSEVEP